MKSRNLHLMLLIVSFCSYFRGAPAHAAITTYTMDQIQLEVADQASFGGLDFIVSTTDVGASGTGTINSFVRIQANGSQQGYNSDAGAEFDEKAGTRSLLTTEVPTSSLTNEGGMSDQFGEFVLDSNDGGLLSLNQVQIFAATTAFATDTNLTSQGVTNTPTEGFPIISFDSPDAVEVFRLSDEGTEFVINIDSSLGSGSGTFDLRLFFDLDIVASLGPQYTHFILYSQFGDPPGTEGSSGGFEEWAVALGDKSAFIPEPSTWALLLMTACGAVSFQYRHQRKLKLATAEANSGAE